MADASQTGERSRRKSNRSKDEGGTNRETQKPDLHCFLARSWLHKFFFFLSVLTRAGYFLDALIFSVIVSTFEQCFSTSKVKSESENLSVCFSLFFVARFK